MTQGFLPFQYFDEKIEPGLTALAGLPLYYDMAIASGLPEKIQETMLSKQRGWTDLQIIMSLILLNIAGGDCVDDIERLEKDDGMRTLMLKVETHGMKSKARRAYEKRWRKSNQRAFPSASAIRRYLEQFHNAEQEQHRNDGEAFIPHANTALRSLLSLNTTLINFAQQQHVCSTATLDQDATLSSTNKRSALYCYKKYKAYQPLNTYWHEQKMLLSSEFRDGNVPAGFEQCRNLKVALQQLPPSVTEVMLRSDSAGYQQDLLSYCAEGKNERFGVIKFAVSCSVTKAFKKAVSQVSDDAWQPIFKTLPKGQKMLTDQEWAEVCFVPNWVAHCKNNPHYRYIAIREKLGQQELALDGEEIESDLPFQTLNMKKQSYKLFGVVTNRDLPGDDLIHWFRERCGDSEKVHSVQKSELAGGQFPSNLFGANAAWWQIMILSHNLNALMKSHALPEALATKSLKGLRFHLICLPGRVVSHARYLVLKIGGHLSQLKQVCDIRQRIIALVKGPPMQVVGSN